MERTVCRGEKKWGGRVSNVIFQFVDLTKVANAEKHAFYTVTLFPIFLVKNLQNSKKIYTTKNLLFIMSSCGYCC